MPTQVYRRVLSVDWLISADELKAELPISQELADRVFGWTTTVENILAGRDPRLLVMCRPCSVLDPAASLAHARLMLKWQQQFPNLFLMDGAFVDKPRSRMVSPADWPGFMNDPHRDGSYDTNLGVRLSRQLMIDMVTLGIPLGMEYMDMYAAECFDDLISYAALGARTVSNPKLRQAASGFGMSVGCKNDETGELDGGIRAIQTVMHPQVVPAPHTNNLMSLIRTAGNPYAHLIQRGGTNGPNYDLDGVDEMLTEAGITTGRVIDLSHGNSGKDPRKHLQIAKRVARRIRNGENIVGVSWEGFLVAGRQDHVGIPLNQLVFGQSGTDACNSSDESEEIMEVLNDAAA